MNGNSISVLGILKGFVCLWSHFPHMLVLACGRLPLGVRFCGLLRKPSSSLPACSDEDDDEDDTAALLAELERIKKERAEEKAKKVRGQCVVAIL